MLTVIIFIACMYILLSEVTQYAYKIDGRQKINIEMLRRGGQEWGYLEDVEGS